MQASGEQGISLSTSSTTNQEATGPGSLSLSSAKDIDMVADMDTRLDGSSLTLASTASGDAQGSSTGGIRVSASETSGVVDIVGQTLSAKTSDVSVSGSDSVSVLMMCCRCQ